MSAPGSARGWSRRGLYGLVALAAVASAAGAGSARAGTSRATVMVAHTVPAPVASGAAARVGAHNASAQLHLLVSMRIRNGGQLAAAIARHIVFTKAQYDARFAPTATQAAALSAWLKGQGLKVTGVAKQNMWVNAEGSTQKVEHTFGVSISDYRYNGRTFYANDQAPTVPASLDVLGIPGLNNYERVHTDLIQTHASAVKRAGVRVGTNAGPTYCPNVISTAYSVNHNASGQTIDMVLWGAPMNSADVAQITSWCPSTQGLSVGGGADQVSFISDGGSSTDTSSWGEVALDIDNGHGIAPGSHINYYLGGAGTSTTAPTPYTSELDAVNDQNSTVISNSFGGNGDSTDPTFDQTLQDGVGLGKSIFFSSGDSSQIEYPSASQYVVSVGGTTLSAGAGGTWTGETTWSNAGRGCSAWNSKPPWQVGTSCNGRQTPDVSADADTGWACYSGLCRAESGTSLAAPLWAGMTADWNSKINATDGGNGVGFVASVLWRTSPTCAPAIFSDNITSNDHSTTIEKWPGGNPTFGSGACTISVHEPSGDIDLIGGTAGVDSWSINSVSGYTAANVAQVGTPNCLSVASSGSVTLNRPTCSNASTAFESGRSTDTAWFNTTPYHDIVSGSTGGVSAGLGFDSATGWGSPVFSQLVNAKIPQGVNFDGIATHTYGDPPFTITPSASSGLGLIVSSTTTGVCSVLPYQNQNTVWQVTILNAGTCSIQASQGGDSIYPAASATQSFTVNQESQTITFASIPNHTFGDPDFTVTPTASSGLAVALTSETAACFISPNGVGGWTVKLVSPGGCTLDANQAGNSNVSAAPQVQQSFTVLVPQGLTFGAIAKHVLPGQPFTVSPTASSGLPVSLVSNTTAQCTVSGFTVTLVGPGICSLTANQAGNGTYAAAAPVTQQFDISTKNIVSNGGFEKPTLANGASQTYSAETFGGWTVLTGSIDLLNNVWQNKAGNQSIDLAGSSPGEIGRQITLPYSGTYTLKFAFAGNPNGAPTRKHMTVIVTGSGFLPVGVAKTFSITGHTTSSMAWKTGKLVFTDTAGDAVTVVFEDTDTATSYGMTLDAVSLAAH